MATQGTVTVNFGSGALEAYFDVTGQSGFTAGTNLVEAWPLANETIGGLQDDTCWVEQMQVYVINQVTATGFRVLMKPMIGKAFGSFNCGWVYN
jgi:hypothetical protein